MHRYKSRPAPSGIKMFPAQSELVRRINLQVSKRVGDGVSLQRLLHELSLLLYMDGVEARGGGCGWGPSDVLDVLNAAPAECPHRSQQTRIDVAVRPHVHRLFLTPHDLGICGTETR
jgi:hypothetical protein